MTFVEGMGQMPEHWRVEQARWLLSRRRRSVPRVAGVVTAFRDGQVTLRQNRRMDGFTEAIQEIGYQGVRRGDLVVHAMDGFAGAIGVSDSDGKSSPVVHVYTGSDDVDLRFMAYVLRHLAGAGFVSSLAKGIRERSTSFDPATLARLMLPVPPLHEQRRIVDFLDGETAKLEKVTSLLAESSRLSAERLCALLDTRLSGQAGPEARRIKVGRLTRLITSGPRGWGDLVGESGPLFFRSANLQRESLVPDLSDVARVTPPASGSSEAGRSRVRVGDVLVGITGANAGWVSLIRDNELAGAYVSQHVCLVRPDERQVRSAWLAYAFKSPACAGSLFAAQYGGTKPQLSLPDLRSLVVAPPSVAEQDGVVARLDAEVQLMERVRAHRTQQVEALRERRLALVAAAVTGQLDVTTARGAA